ncbi:MAG: hypothetical protein GWN79_02155, partial [Actinobacteria bacterium]|nr:hypothetical protein [Actinomycetota bacterium]NIU17963.1 hypothetical protein [Actinomycetota bacterium]NIV54459.1 hypothetical protein [Actinomycetota bacterium]NIW36448.1 hypothetical protein [Gemmatimonadota bacterium]NIX49347.1 hypothetical protein [Actinomycetota bacterium]
SKSGLPDDARLLGALAGTRPAVFKLPAEAVRQPGRLSFYSLTQQELVAQLDLPAVRGED